MSEIRWCDPGGHAFSMNDPDRQEYAATTVTIDAKGREVRERIDICGPCHKSNAMGITTLETVANKVKAVGNGETKQDRDRTVPQDL